MAQNTYTKNDIIEFIQDAIAQREGLPPSMVKDIESVAKMQVEMDSADSFIRELASDQGKIRDLLEGVLEGRETVINVVNVESPDNSPASSGDDSKTSKDDTSSDTNPKTFRDAVQEGVSSGMGFMGVAIGKMTGTFSDIYGSISSSFSGQINTILGEEKQNVIDPVTNFIKSIGGMFGKFRSYDAVQIGLSKDSRRILQASLDTENKQLDVMSGGQQAMRIAGARQMDKLDDINSSLTGMLRSQLEGMKMAKDEYLRRIREANKKKQEDKGLIERIIENFIIAGIAGLVSGAIAGAFWKPFQVLIGAAKGVVGMFRTVEDAGKGTARVIDLIGDLAKGSGKLAPVARWMIRFTKLFEQFGFVARTGEFIKTGVDFVKDLFAAATNFPKIIDTVQNLMGFTDAAGDTVKMTAKIAQQIEKIPVLGKSILKIANFFGDIITAMTGFIKNSAGLSKVFGAFGETIKFFLRFATSFKVLLGPFGMFIKMFGVAFRFLAWPLTILLGIIDFFKGFFGSSEATFMGKIKDGLKQVIIGFFEMPLRLLGWIYDKALQMIGLESSGTGDKIISELGQLIDNIFKPIIWVFTTFGKMIKVPAKIFIKTVYNTVTFLFRLVNAVFDFIKAPLVMFFSGIKNVFSLLGSVFSGIWQVVKGLVGGFIGLVGNILGFIWNVLTLDFEGAFGNLSRIKEIVVESLFTIFNGIMDIFDGLKEFILSQIGLVSGLIKGLLGGIFDFLMAPFRLVYDQVVGMFQIAKEAFGGTIFQPIISMFEAIGGFIQKVVEWVTDKLKSIPVVGKIFKDEDDKALEERQKLTARAEEIRLQQVEVKKNIAAIEADPDPGFFDRRKLKKLKKQDAELAEQQGKIAKELGVGEQTAEVKSSRGSILGFVKESTKSHIGTVKTGVIHTTKIGDEQTNNVYRNQMIADTAKQFEHTTSKTVYPVADLDARVQQAKAEKVREQINSTKEVRKEIAEMSKKQNEKEERPIIVNTGEKDKRVIEPPEDIEAMSILFLNKSWGLG